MKSFITLALLMASLAWGAEPALQKFNLKCVSTANTLGDFFEYDFKIEERINGLGFQLASGSTTILKPMNFERGIPTWHNIQVQPNQIIMSKDTCDRFTQLCTNEKFIYDRGTQDFSLARSTRELVKTASQSQLIQIQSGTCSDK